MCGIRRERFDRQNLDDESGRTDKKQSHRLRRHELGALRASVRRVLLVRIQQAWLREFEVFMSTRPAEGAGGNHPTVGFDGLRCPHGRHAAGVERQAAPAHGRGRPITGAVGIIKRRWRRGSRGAAAKPAKNKGNHEGPKLTTKGTKLFMRTRTLPLAIVAACLLARLRNFSNSDGDANEDACADAGVGQV